MHQIDDCVFTDDRRVWGRRREDKRVISVAHFLLGAAVASVVWMTLINVIVGKLTQ